MSPQLFTVTSVISHKSDPKTLGWKFCSDISVAKIEIFKSEKKNEKKNHTGDKQLYFLNS